MHNRLHNQDYGIRADDIAYKVGDVLPKSRVWSNDTVTDMHLDGTCTIDARLGAKKVRRLIKSYGCKYFYIVKGQALNAGDDIGELIIQNATVVKVIKIK